MTTELTDHTVIVTGGAQGPGRAGGASVRRCWRPRRGADIEADLGAMLAEELGERVRFVRLDVTSEDDWRGLLASLNDWPPPWTLVNNGGVHWFRSLADEPAAEQERMLGVNVVGPQIGMRHVMEPMARAGGGSIVNVWWLLSMLGSGNSSSYVASQWALRGMTKAASLALGQKGIRVNAVLPGYIETPMLDQPGGGAARGGPGMAPCAAGSAAGSVISTSPSTAGRRAGRGTRALRG